MIKIIPNTLGLIEYKDPKSDLYKVNLDGLTLPDIPYGAILKWNEGPTPFQGYASTCVAHAFQNEMRCAPDVTDKFPKIETMYNAARARGEKQGRHYPDGGTTLTDMAAVLKDEFELLEKYHWISLEIEPQRRLDKLLLYLTYYGAVVAASRWYPNMENTNMRPTGKYLGGHAYLFIGVDFTNQELIVQNSRGRNWFGNNKNALQRMPFYVFIDLFSRSGSDLCCPLVFPDFKLDNRLIV